MVFITGDKHGDFSNVLHFANIMQTNKQDDMMIVLGDAGINYYGGKKDKALKDYLSSIPITFFLIRGNHEMRPGESYTLSYNAQVNGHVLVEDQYPSLLFAIDGEMYNINGKQCMVIGGAYSVDKYVRLQYHMPWFENEQLSKEEMDNIYVTLEQQNWNMPVILSHTCPRKYVPIDTFLSFVDQSTVDNTMEDWLDTVENKLNYKQWWCGHYHINRMVDKIHFLFEDIVEFV